MVHWNSELTRIVKAAARILINISINFVLRRGSVLMISSRSQIGRQGADPERNDEGEGVGWLVRYDNGELKWLPRVRGKRPSKGAMQPSILFSPC